MLRRVPERVGRTVSPRGRRRHLLEVGGGVSEGELSLWIGYSRELHREEGMERLAGCCREACEEILEHCRGQEQRVHTPSDFPEAGLSQRELDELLAEIGPPP